MGSENVVEFKAKGGGTAGEQRPDDRRWYVQIEYRSEEGGSFVGHYIEELDELAQIVEVGPHWDTIIKCVVTLNRRLEDIPRLTKEQAELL